MCVWWMAFSLLERFRRAMSSSWMVFFFSSPSSSRLLLICLVSGTKTRSGALADAEDGPFLAARPAFRNSAIDLGVGAGPSFCYVQDNKGKGSTLSTILHYGEELYKTKCGEGYKTL